MLVIVVQILKDDRVGNKNDIYLILISYIYLGIMFDKYIVW